MQSINNWCDGVLLLLLFFLNTSSPLAAPTHTTTTTATEEPFIRKKNTRELWVGVRLLLYHLFVACIALYIA
eukprot:gene13432-9243_t